VDAQTVLVDFAVFQAQSLTANPAGLRKRIDGHNASPPEVHTERLPGEDVYSGGPEFIRMANSCRYGSVPKEGVGGMSGVKTSTAGGIVPTLGKELF
jgi:hypothetical protein